MTAVAEAEMTNVSFQPEKEVNGPEKGRMGAYSVTQGNDNMNGRVIVIKEKIEKASSGIFSNTFHAMAMMVLTSTLFATVSILNPIAGFQVGVVLAMAVSPIIISYEIAKKILS